MPVSIWTLAAALMWTAPADAQMQTWNIDPAHTSAQFSVRQMGISTLRGAFTKVTGLVQYDTANLEKTTIALEVDATSVDTRIEMAGQRPACANFFDTAKYPTLTFKSERVEPGETGKLKVTGDLTIHGVTKEVVLDVDGPSTLVSGQEPRVQAQL